MDQPGLLLVPIWDAGTAGGSLPCAMVLCSFLVVSFVFTYSASVAELFRFKILILLEFITIFDVKR